MAATVTASDLKTRLPEFNSAEDDRVELFIADAQLQINATQWGDLCTLGVVYLAAHLMCTVGNLDGSGAVAPGPVKKEKVGEVSAEYAVGSSGKADDDFLASTVYGQAYLDLKRKVFPERFASSKRGL